MFKKTSQFLSNFPLKRKIFAIVLFNIIAFTGTSFAGIQVVNNATNKLLYQSTASTLSFSATDISKEIDSVSRLSSMMIADNTIQNNLITTKRSGSTIARASAYQSLYTTVQSYYQQFKQNHLSYISLYNDRFATHTYASKAESLPNEIRKELIRTGQEKGGYPVWITKYSNQYGLFLVRAVRQIQNVSLDDLGVLVICIDLNQLVQASTDYSNQYKGSSYLLFDNQKLMYYSAGLSKEKFKKIQKQLNDPYAIISLDQTRYFSVKGYIPNYNWKYISLVEYNSIYQSIRFSQTIYFVMIIMCAFLSALLSDLLILSFTRHFDKLIIKMKAFGNQNATLVDVGYSYQNRTDEVGVLHRQFDSMAKQIQNLIIMNYSNEILRKDAQLKALETEINPHFLYNTLESVNWRAKAIGEQQISQMVESLGMLLRTTLSEKAENSTLKQELELIQYYITIQQIRFEERLSYHINVDESLLNASIPKLTIQPLVENSIHYALEEMVETCYIDVIVQKSGDDLQILVRNSGSQFEENLLKKLDSNQIQPHGLGIGLQNIHKRLQLMFGNTYGLSLFNEGDTAVAEITIPYYPI